MTSTTKGDVESACKSLNEVAQRVQMDRTFIVWFGSQVQGTQHALAEVHPGLSHPTETKIGATYAEAYRYLTGMRHALESVEKDRRYRREDAKAGAVSGISIFEKPVPKYWTEGPSFASPEGHGPVNSVGPVQSGGVQ